MEKYISYYSLIITSDDHKEKTAWSCLLSSYLSKLSVCLYKTVLITIYGNFFSAYRYLILKGNQFVSK